MIYIHSCKLLQLSNYTLSPFYINIPVKHKILVQNQDTAQCTSTILRLLISSLYIFFFLCLAPKNMCISWVKVRLHNRPSISKLYICGWDSKATYKNWKWRRGTMHPYILFWAIERSCGEDRRENGLWEIPSFSPLGSPYLFKYHLFTARYLR